MNIASRSVINWFCALQVSAAAAVVYAFTDIGTTLIAALMMWLISFIGLHTARSQDVEHCKKISDLFAIMGMLLFLPLVLFKSVLLALLVLLLLAQWALNFITREHRPLYYGLVISFVGVCVGAVEAKHGTYLLCFLLYIICGSQCLSHLHIDREVQLAGVEKDAQVDTHKRIYVIGLFAALAVVLYLLIPRLPAANIGSGFYGNAHFYQNPAWEKESQQENNQNETLSSDFSPGSNSPSDVDKKPSSPTKDLQDYPYQGFQDRFDIRDPDPDNQRFSNRLIARMQANRGLYLRAQIFDVFDGLRWSKSTEDLQKISLQRGSVELEKEQPYGHMIQQQIYIEANIGDFIPAAAVPQSLTFPASVIAQDRFKQLKSPGKLNKGTIYTVKSQLSWQQGRLFSERQYGVELNYRQLPKNFDPRIKNLATKITQGAANQFAKAVLLEQHLRNEYEYSFESIFNSQNQTPLNRFLFEDKSGHCEYFAAALAIMLRSLQIPARLVTGFSATQQNPLTGYYEIYALDGHAWVEAYVDNLGWMVLEPTAYYQIPPEQSEEWLSAEKIDQYVEHITQMEKSLPEEQRQTVTLMLASLWQALALLFTVILGYLKLFLYLVWPWLLGLGILGLVGHYLWSRYRTQIRAYWLYQRVSRYKNRGDPEQAVDFYLSAINKLMAPHRLNRRAGMTLETYISRLEQLLTTPPASDEMVQTINALKYASAEPVKPCFIQAPEQLRALFFSLYQSKSLGQRLPLKQ